MSYSEDECCWIRIIQRINRFALVPYLYLVLMRQDFERVMDLSFMDAHEILDHEYPSVLMDEKIIHENTIKDSLVFVPRVFLMEMLDSLFVFQLEKARGIIRPYITEKAPTPFFGQFVMYYEGDVEYDSIDPKTCVRFDDTILLS